MLNRRRRCQATMTSEENVQQQTCKKISESANEENNGASTDFLNTHHVAADAVVVEFNL